MKYRVKQLLSWVLVLAMCIGFMPNTLVSAQQQPIEDNTNTEINSLTRPDNIDTIDENAGAEYINDTNLAPAVSYDNCTALLIQSTRPWDSDANTDVLNLLKTKGYLKSYETTSMSKAATKDFSKYSAVILANDQATDSYTSYELIRANLEKYIYNGGTVLFGACDNGWANGQFQNSLPAQVTKFRDMSYYNYVADKEHYIVTGALTNGTGAALTDNMLYDTWCSHTSFNEDSLPENNHVILRSKNTDAPTLVEYPYGKGHVIASGLTWEFGYIARNPNGGMYSRNSYIDLFVYALYLSGARFQGSDYNPTIHDFNYNENTPSEELAKKCSLLSLLAYQECDKDNRGNWIQTHSKDQRSKKWLGKELLDEGYEDLYSYNYDGAVPYTKLKKAKSKNKEEAENSILYTIGHRRVKINGDIQDQIVIVFRGTTDTQWYGNFDITGTTYNDLINDHWSFQQAVNEAMGELANYIQEISNSGRLDMSSLSVLVTGHSRGAAVSNLMAHELTDIQNDRISDYSNETYVNKFSDYNIKSVYAYTFATPNVATHNKINSCEKYNNIFNYCFTDDFVPNLPLENWKWGKYGKTYLTTVTTLSKDKDFQKQVRDFLTGGIKGLAPFSEKYTNNIISAIADGTSKKGIFGTDRGGVYNYYNNQLGFLLGNNSGITLYNFLRTGLGGTMQGTLDGAELIVSGLLANSPVIRKLSGNLIIGGVFNPALNTNHQCGTYYIAIHSKFNAFKLDDITDNEYFIAENSQEDASEHDKDQVAALKVFLSTVVDEADSQTTYADLLGWQLDDSSTWEGVTWENGSVVSIDISYANDIKTIKNLDLTKFPNLSKIDCSYNKLTELNLSSSSIKVVYCEGNKLRSIDLSALTNLTEVNCSFNELTGLTLANCTNLEILDCSNNSLNALNLDSCTSLKDLSCDYNELDITQGNLASKIQAMDNNKTSSVIYLPQKMISNAPFAENDKQRLLNIANSQNNNSILKWNLNDPASWSQVSWVMDNGTYYLEGVDFTDLKLEGTANFDGCGHLNFVEISGNNFTDLSLDGCSALEKLFCKNNRMDETKLEGIVSGFKNDLSYIVDCQKAYSESDYSEEDLYALDNLVNAYGLEWEKSLYSKNTALKWAKDASGIYVLTSLDLSGTNIYGEVDLTEFANLKSVKAKNTKIESIILPDSISKIDNNAFENCKDLTEVTLPEDLTSIEGYAFYNCELLRTITIPSKVTKIGQKAFGNCKRLYFVSFDGETPNLASDAFEGCAANFTLNLLFEVSTLELEIGQQYMLSTDCFPKGSNISWESSKPSVATVDETGNITALSAGAALITASSGNGFSATCTVLVNGDYPEPPGPGPTKPDYVLYVNGGNVKQADNTRINYKVRTYKTTIEASTITTTNKKGKTKTKKGKLIAGVTLSESMPNISKGKFPSDKDAKKIAVASVNSKGIVKITAKSQPGEVYLWVMDTGDNKAYTCKKVSVKSAPNKLQIFAQPDAIKNTKNIYRRGNIGLEDETKLYLYPTYKLNGKAQKTEDATYTISVDNKAKDYFTVSQDANDPYSFSVKAVSLKDNKKVTGKITIKCNENGKKAVFSATAVNYVQKITLKSDSDPSLEVATGTAVLSIEKSDTASTTKYFEVAVSKNNDSFDTTDKLKLYAMGTEKGFDTNKMKEGKIKITSRANREQKKLSVKLEKDKKTLKVTAAKGVPAGTEVYYLLVYNTLEGKGYRVIKVVAI